MANASKKHFGPGAQGKHSGTGAGAEIQKEKIGDNMVLSNRDKSQHPEGRGLDGKEIQNEQFQEHAGSLYPDEDE